MMMFIRHAKQVAFVIEMDFTAGLNQQEAVNRTAVRLQRGATGNQRVGLVGFSLHPGYHFLLRQRLFCCFHRETGGEHFG